jgi:hypothetical protein
MQTDIAAPAQSSPPITGPAPILDVAEEPLIMQIIARQDLLDVRATVFAVLYIQCNTHTIWDARPGG